jgi:hypothetical protein
MNKKTLNLLTEWCKYNNKKIRNVKKIFLATPIEKRGEAIKAIKEDLMSTVKGRVADVLEAGVAAKNLCATCEYEGSYPICAPTQHKKLKDKKGNMIVLQCNNHMKLEEEVKDAKKK